MALSGKAIKGPVRINGSYCLPSEKPDSKPRTQSVYEERIEQSRCIS